MSTDTTSHAEASATDTPADLPADMPTDPIVRVSKIGYLGLQTPDPARLIEYYTKVLDFAVVEESPTQAFLTTGFDHHCVVIDKAEIAHGRTAIGYEIHGSLDEAHRGLTAAGIEVSRRTDVGPATPDVLVITEPSTGTPLHLYENQTVRIPVEAARLRPTKLGHVAAWSPGVSQMQQFYQDALGFRWSDQIGDFFVFLRCNVDHHAANFMTSHEVEGLHHVAYEMRDLNHLQSLIDNLARNDVRLHWGPGRHGAGHNIFTYPRDPDGNQVELFTQLDVIYDEERGYFEPRPWHEEFPQYPKTWEADMLAMNVWGPMSPMDRPPADKKGDR